MKTIGVRRIVGRPSAAKGRPAKGRATKSRAAKRWAAKGLAALLWAGAAASPGCAELQDRHAEVVSDFRARHTWHRCTTLAGHFEISADYRRGWQEGFSDVLMGGSGNAPPIPPHRYWSACNQECSGLGRIERWYRGYQDGAIAARRSGYWTEIPIRPTGGPCPERCPGRTEMAGPYVPFVLAPAVGPAAGPALPPLPPPADRPPAAPPADLPGDRPPRTPPADPPADRPPAAPPADPPTASPADPFAAPFAAPPAEPLAEVRDTRAVRWVRTAGLVRGSAQTAVTAADPFAEIRPLQAGRSGGTGHESVQTAAAAIPRPERPVWAGR